jgi:glucose/arabinose dehydrogenase
MKGVLIGVSIVVVAGVGACSLLLPERFAVNAPIAQMLFGRGIGAPDSTVVDQRMKLPSGFSLSLWADDVVGARMMRFTPAGDLLVSSPKRNAIVLVERDSDGDGRSDGERLLLEELANPHGVELYESWLYVGETGALSRVGFDPGRPANEGGPSGARLTSELERLVTDIPPGGNHWTRTIRIGPDGWLYMHVGSSCNVCREDDPDRRAAMLRFRPDGSGEETFATGLRNSVGFDWQPGTNALYATDNGRDLLGDDFPPCELNRLERGGFYGFPIANGDRVPDPDYGDGHEREIAASIPPAFGFRAHTAPLGMTFIRGDRVPPDYRNAALVALHGSWNRTRKDGYKVVSLHWKPDGSIEERDFMTGFELNEDVIGRPVDVIVGPDGAFYISDDYAGVIWRAAYTAGEDRSS